MGGRLGPRASTSKVKRSSGLGLTPPKLNWEPGGAALLSRARRRRLGAARCSQTDIYIITFSSLRVGCAVADRI